MMLLESITAMTTSGDKIWLAVYDTKKKCHKLQIEEETVNEVLERFQEFSTTIRKSNPFSF
jgi:hypothetical protein